MSKRRCAYCGKNEKLTREHIFPKFLLNSLPDYKSIFSIKGMPRLRFYKEVYEPKIRDVCINCNSRLGVLDRYASSFIKKYCLKILTFKQISITFDFDLLLRWLLKVSYNSSRVSGFNNYLFEPYIPYILEGYPRPKDTALFAGLIKPTFLTENEKKSAPKKFAELGYIPPEFIRIHNILFNPRDYLGLLPLKGILIKSFSFLIFQYLDECNLYPLYASGYVRLSPSGNANINFTKFDILSFMKDQLLLTKKEFENRVKELDYRSKGFEKLSTSLQYGLK